MPDRWKARLADPFGIYMLLAPLLYLAFALITPPFQTPDEQQHLFRAYQLASFDLIGERRGDRSGGVLPPGLLRATERELGSAEPHVERGTPKTTWAERFSRATPIGQSEPGIFANFLGSVSYSPVGYGPQILAVWVGQAIDLSVESIVRLGRIFNAMLTFALLCMAFRFLPFGRTALLLVGLLPMTAACAGSFGQDGMIIGAGAWLVALGLRSLIHRSWSKRDGRIAVLLAIAITLAKFVYLPLVALALFVRSSSGRLRLAWPPLVAAGLAGALLIMWLMLNTGLTVPMMADRPLPTDQLRYVIDHPLAFPKALIAAYSPGEILRLSGTLFYFGWLKVGPLLSAWAISLAAVTLVCWQGDAKAHLLLRRWHLWSLSLCATMVLALSFALYLAATALGAGAVDGVQGRYFIPLFLPVLLALTRRRPIVSAWVPACAAGLMVLANLIALTAISEAFYTS